MDKKYLKDKKLYEAHKQFMRLCEWSYVPMNLEEDDDEEQNDDAQQMPSDDSQMADANSDAMGSDMQADNAPMQGGDDMNQQEPTMDDMGGDMNQMTPQQQEMPPMDNPMNGMEAGEEDEVIDVDDITNAQEKMNTKVNHVGNELGDVRDKITSMLSSISNLEQMINNNNQEIIKFKQEFEKRNPTQTEKLNLRSLDSYPFNVSPSDYWKEKGLNPNSNYSAYGDNEEPTTDEYEITNNDVDDFSEREMEKSFDIDDEWKQDINKIFGL